MTHGSLFAGIGGFDLGFERAGIETIWQVEIDEYARRVLAKHFPWARRFADIRQCGRHNLQPVDIISGGFPCQDISLMGEQSGITDGERSGLWEEMRRIIFELGPRYVVVENVAALLQRDIGRVLGDLAAGGYDAEWDCLPASAFGAPHRRDRVFIVGYAERARLERHAGNGSYGACQQSAAGSTGASGLRGGTQADVADAEGICKREPATQADAEPTSGGTPPFVGGRSWWFVEPRVGRVAHGVPRRVDRLKGLGNAVVPQIAEWIGRRLND